MENGEPLLQTATKYLRTLSQLMLSMEATDQLGAALTIDEGADRAVRMMLSVQAASRKVMLTGNGGSAAIASHVQSDLCKAVGVRALVFTEQPLLMALSNDLGYEHVFEQPVQLWAEPDDLLVCISSSGESENILRAAQASSKAGCRVITLSGFNPDNPLRKMGDLNFYVASDVYGYVESAHAALTHFMTDLAARIIRTRTHADART